MGALTFVYKTLDRLAFIAQRSYVIVAMLLVCFRCLIYVLNENMALVKNELSQIFSSTMIFVQHL